MGYGVKNNLNLDLAYEKIIKRKRQIIRRYL